MGEQRGVTGARQQQRSRYAGRPAVHSSRRHAAPCRQAPRVAPHLRLVALHRRRHLWRVHRLLRLLQQRLPAGRRPGRGGGWRT